MKRVNLVMSALLVFGLISLSTSGYAQDKEISKSKVPQKVLNAFHKAYPKAEIKGTSIEKENGHSYYEIESMEGTKHIDLLINHEGKITEVERSVPAKELPAPVKKTLMAKFKGYKIHRAEKVTSGGKISYELLVKSGNKKAGVVLDAKGNILKVEKMNKENEKEEKSKKEEKEENDND